MSATAEACADVRRYLLERDPALSMMKTDPLLYLAYYVEAAGDRRIETDVIAPSLLTDIRDRARKAIEQHTGARFFNPLYR